MTTRLPQRKETLHHLSADQPRGGDNDHGQRQARRPAPDPRPASSLTWTWTRTTA